MYREGLGPESPARANWKIWGFMQKTGLGWEIKPKGSSAGRAQVLREPHDQGLGPMTRRAGAWVLPGYGEPGWWWILARGRDGPSQPHAGIQKKGNVWIFRQPRKISVSLL